MRRDSCTALPFLFCIALVVSIEAQSAGARARVAPQVAAPAVASSISRSGHQHLDPFYSSKRRVPNGPDPIHNSCFDERERENGYILLEGGTTKQGPENVAVEISGVPSFAAALICVS
ncbi:hypothetical protein ZIOFF_022594 [Zingiber officinale]|uniref:Uncharacterized protein n=1 Tax=Zingiber officinale TaxID=94328 RepID=A0A8J5H9U9_ZINOF|nr:hypothetical protein ZIOFF_022594 [Zingiber officinale]